MSKAFEWLIDFVYPNRCPFCGEFIAWNKEICEICEKELEPIDFCPKCGQQKSGCKCGDELLYDGCAVLYPYAGAVRDGILRLKYKDGFDTARFAVPKLADVLREHGLTDIDVITAVPMTKKRRRETGYNQAEYIARLLSRRLAVPCDFRLIGKSVTAPTQHNLAADERKTAAQEAYYAENRRIDGKTVLLCDDILTTGSTLSACAGILKSMGAGRVYCAVLAATPFDEK